MYKIITSLFLQKSFKVYRNSGRQPNFFVCFVPALTSTQSFCEGTKSGAFKFLDKVLEELIQLRFCFKLPQGVLELNDN